MRLDWRSEPCAGKRTAAKLKPRPRLVSASQDKPAIPPSPRRPEAPERPPIKFRIRTACSMGGSMVWPRDASLKNGAGRAAKSPHVLVTVLSCACYVVTLPTSSLKKKVLPPPPPPPPPPYGIDNIDVLQKAAFYLDRILRGAKPADLPVQAPTKYETAINLTTAKALGLSVPPTLLATADEVIE